MAGRPAAANHAAAGEQALPHSHSERRVGGWMGRGLLPCAQNGGEGGKAAMAKTDLARPQNLA